MEVPLHIAILGGTIRIPTIDGDVDLTIPSGTQPNELKKLTSRGLPKINRSSRGDQIITLKVAIPKKITSKQKELLLEAFGGEKEEESGGIFKNLFK